MIHGIIRFVFPSTSFIGTGFRLYHISLAESSATPTDCVRRLGTSLQISILNTHFVGGADPGTVAVPNICIGTRIERQLWPCCVFQVKLA